MAEESIEAVVSRLRAEVDEDERVARYSGDSWSVGACVDAEERGGTEWLILEYGTEVARVRGNMRVNHIARQDPAATLARVAAYQAILDLWERTAGEWSGCVGVDSVFQTAREDTLEEVVRLLAGSRESAGL